MPFPDPFSKPFFRIAPKATEAGSMLSPGQFRPLRTNHRTLA